MSLRTFTTFLAIIVASLGLSSCQYHMRRFAKPSPTPGTVVQWPTKPFTEVRAYCYDYTSEMSRSFFVNGRMHKGVQDPKGVKLTAEQVKQLQKAITVSQPKGPRTPCYAPHHAFVYYDAQGKVVGWLEMCFGCNQQLSYPAGVPEYVDRIALWNLAGDLNLPLGKGNKFYADVCRRR